MYLVPERHWVVANFKEAQTANIRIGQPATLRVDALGGAKLTGHVESVAPAAGSEFSVIRSEEHTSELQSLMRISYAVFCLKKKNQHKSQIYKLNTCKALQY